MAGSKYKLAERVLRLLKSGDPSAASRIHIDELKVACEGVINSMLKTEYFSETMAAGETIPEGAVLATYDAIPVVTYKGKSKSTLPCMPVKLVRNMGIFHVSDTVNIDDPFIPVQAGQFALVKGLPIMNDLLGQIGYESFGKDIVYTKDLTALSTPITTVFIRLVVMDISSYTDYEILPLSADQEHAVVKEVYQMFASEQPADKIVDSTQENK